MKELKKGVQNLISEELERAIQQYGLHNSSHEKYSVILEEVDEALDEVECIGQYLNDLWDAIKRNDDNGIKIFVDLLHTAAINLACEAIQVAAMCEKSIRLEFPTYSELKKKTPTQLRELWKAIEKEGTIGKYEGVDIHDPKDLLSEIEKQFKKNDEPILVFIHGNGNYPSIKEEEPDKGE